MKWLRTLIIFDRGNIVTHPDWRQMHESYVRSIQSIKFPEGSDALTIRQKQLLEGSKSSWRRNGVGYLKTNFFMNLTKVEGWKPESAIKVDNDKISPQISLYPSGERYFEEVNSRFGEFDFTTTGSNGLRTAIEWETGNISSSHRSMNKLAISLGIGVIDAGVLILPSRELYKHLTDRIGNIDELSGYLGMWESLKFSVAKGLLAITVVEHDFLTEDDSFPYLPSGNDGRAKEGQHRYDREKSSSTRK